LKDRLIYKAKHFTVEIEIGELNSDKIFIGKISTNCDQKVYVENELLVLTGKLRNSITTFGCVTRIKSFLNKEIKFVSFNENKIVFKDDYEVSLAAYEEELEFKFFCEDFYQIEIEEFNLTLDDFIKKEM
jgi:hypothetical protein